MNKRNTAIIAFVVLIMATLMCFAGCGKTTTEATAPAVTATEAPAPVATPTEAPATEAPTEPAPTEPEWVPGKARANYVGATVGTLAKGEKVDIVGKFAHYYVISAEPCNLLVDESYIRLNSEKAFTSYTIYARNDAPVFESVYMNTAPVANLSTNTLLTVLEEHAGWVYVEWSEGKGYMRATDTSINRIYIGGRDDDSSGPSDGTDVNVGDLLSATDVQGSVMLLGAYHGPAMEERNEKGVVIADNIETYIAVYGFGDELKVIEAADDYCTIYLDTDLTAKVPRAFVKLEGDAEEEPSVGYVKSLALAYREYQNRNQYLELQFNAELQVLYKLPGLYHDSEEICVVQVDGEIMYMTASGISAVKHQNSLKDGVTPDLWTPPVL